MLHFLMQIDNCTGKQLEGCAFQILKETMRAQTLKDAVPTPLKSREAVAAERLNYVDNTLRVLDKRIKHGFDLILSKLEEKEHKKEHFKS